MKIFKLSLILFCIVLMGCKTKATLPVASEPVQEEPDYVYISLFEHYYPDFQQHALRDTILRNLPKTGLVRDFYSSNDYRPVWMEDTLNISALQRILSCFQSSGKHGLEPELFKVLQIQSLADSIQSGMFRENESKLYKALANLELLTVNSLIDYSTILNYGFTNPQKLFLKAYNIPVQETDSGYYKTLFKSISQNTDSLLISLQPKDETYKKLQDALVFYRSLQDSLFEPVVSKKKGNFKVNDADDIFPRMAKRLMMSGELPYSKNADSLYATLTPQLLDAVNLFRVNNSYPAENEIGKITVDALNRPFSYYYDKVKANLERYRWKRKTPLPEKYVEVNVAAFNLKAIAIGKKAVLMNVCVGNIKNQTPLLESQISYVNLNPVWNVPTSIIEKEIYHSIVKDSAYLAKNRMKLIKNGEEVDPSTIDWGSINPKQFPYQIKQDSGDGNSLGRIKFMFQNPFSVYLHDTPSKRTFSVKNRAVSHGCVRLQKPIDLANFCITGVDSVSFDRIRYTIDQPPLSQEGKALLKKGTLKKVSEVVSLEKRVPLFIDYFTAYMLPDDNRLYFADDVYGFDSKIISGLASKRKN